MKKRIISNNSITSVDSLKKIIKSADKTEARILAKLWIMHHNSWEDYLSGVLDLSNIQNINLPGLAYIYDSILDDGAAEIYQLINQAYDELRKEGESGSIQASNVWPEELTYDDYDEGDQLISGLLEACDQSGIFEEPSAQGGIGADFFFDEDGEELFNIDLSDETEQLLNLYYKSKSYDDYVQLVCKWLDDKSKK